MALTDTLTQQLGPLPVWTWGAILGVGIGVLGVFIKGKPKPAAAPPSTQPTANDLTADPLGSNALAGGYGYDVGSNLPNTFTTYVCPDGTQVSDLSLCSAATATPPSPTANPPVVPGGPASGCPNPGESLSIFGCQTPQNLLIALKQAGYGVYPGVGQYYNAGTGQLQPTPVQGPQNTNMSAAEAVAPAEVMPPGTAQLAPSLPSLRAA